MSEKSARKCRCEKRGKAGHRVGIQNVYATSITCETRGRLQQASSLCFTDDFHRRRYDYHHHCRLHMVQGVIRQGANTTHVCSSADVAVGTVHRDCHYGHPPAAVEGRVARHHAAKDRCPVANSAEMGTPTEERS